MQLTSQSLSFQTHTPILHEHTHTQVTITEGVGTLFLLLIPSFLFLFSFFPGNLCHELWELLSLSLSLSCLSLFSLSLSLSLLLKLTKNKTLLIHMLQIIEFDTVAREWRMKWSQDDDKASLAAAQKALEKQLATVKAVKGVKSVQRVVCGGCMDFKVIVSLDGDSFGEWEAAGFAPEADFSRKLKPSKVFNKSRRKPSRSCPCKVKEISLRNSRKEQLFKFSLHCVKEVEFFVMNVIAYKWMSLLIYQSNSCFPDRPLFFSPLFSNIPFFNVQLSSTSSL